MEKETQKPQPQQQAVQKYENIAESVLARIKQFEAQGTMKLPKNYIPENQLKSAWLMLQEVKDKNGNAALQVCSKESIARCLLDMVLQGLSPVKKQVYFIPYADKLTCVRSYFGTVQLAKQSGGLTADPVANVIYEGDEFVYEIDPATGITKVIKHSQKLENVNLEKIRGAYCILQRGDRTEVTVMTMAQIRKSWEQGAAKGASPAHRNFTDEMCKKTVIGRACKMAINSSDDAWLYEDMKDDENLDTAAENRNEAVRKAPVEITTETVEFEEINAPMAQPPEPKPEKSDKAEAQTGDTAEPVQTYSNNPAKDGARLPGF